MKRFIRSNFFAAAALFWTCSGQAFAQPPTTANVNAVVGVSSGSLSISVPNASATTGFFFLPTAPSVATSPAVGQLPIVRFSDDRGGDQIGYTITVQTTDFTSGANTIDSDANWRLTGTPVASVSMVSGGSIPPAAVSFGSPTGFEATPQVIIRQVSLGGGPDGQGTFEATLNAAGWPVSVPAGTPNGVYTGTVTFTILPNP